MLNKYGMLVYDRLEYEQRYIHEANHFSVLQARAIPDCFFDIYSVSNRSNGSNYRVLVDTFPSTTNVDYHLRYIQIIANPSKG